MENAPVVDDLSPSTLLHLRCCTLTTLTAMREVLLTAVLSAPDTAPDLDMVEELRLCNLSLLAAVRDVVDSPADTIDDVRTKYVLIAGHQDVLHNQPPLLEVMLDRLSLDIQAAISAIAT